MARDGALERLAAAVPGAAGRRAAQRDPGIAREKQGGHPGEARRDHGREWRCRARGAAAPRRSPPGAWAHPSAGPPRRAGRRAALRALGAARLVQSRRLPGNRPWRAAPGPLLSKFVGERQVELEGTALSRVARQADLPAKQAGQLTADRQPEAGAAVLPARRAVGLLKCLEDDPLLVCRDADAGI